MPQNELDESAPDLEHADGEQNAGLTADEISEQAVAAFYKRTWSAVPSLQETVPEQSAFARMHDSPGTLHVAGLTDIAHITNALFPQNVEGVHPVRPAIPPELIKRRDEVRAYAAKVLKSEKNANEWFERPMTVVLDRKRPAEHLQTLEGCDAVEEFLRTFYPPEDIDV